jgi:(R)-2-hydroxyacyl-CoA dehydratese activating ATPase
MSYHEMWKNPGLDLKAHDQFLQVLSEGYQKSFLTQKNRSAKKADKINSMCTVFAESEVISALSRGTQNNEIALGIHNSIIYRAIGLLNKVSMENKLVLAGGVAHNPAIAELLRRKLNIEVIVPESAQTIGAFGSALLAKKFWKVNYDLS